MLNNFLDRFIFTNALHYRQNQFFLMNVPFLICPVDVLSGLLSTGNQDFEKQLYASVRKNVKENLVSQFGFGFGLESAQMVDFLSKFFTASGWGMLQSIDLDFKTKKAIVKVANSPFASRLHKKPSMPADHLLRGVIAGIFSSAFASDVDCVETHCTALGEADCEFIVKQQHLFDFSDKRVRQQLQLEI